MKHIVNVSHGKDSQTLVLKMIELNYPIDEVIHFHMKGAEFKAIENMSYKTEMYCKQLGIKYTRLEPEHDFMFYATEKEVHKRTGDVQCGYKWCGNICRWGTGIKLDAINKHYSDTYGDEPIVEYVGISADECSRINRKRNGNRVKVYPLVEWGMTEKDCLKYCYDRGWNWEQDGYNLYDLLDRLSCKYCGNKNLFELRNIYHCLPDVWAELKALQDAIGEPYRDGKTISDFERRFEREDMQSNIFEFFKF